MAINWNKKGCDVKEGMWADMNGHEMLIKDMCPEYIENCINYIRVFGGVLTDAELEKIAELEAAL